MMSCSIGSDRRCRFGVWLASVGATGILLSGTAFAATWFVSPDGTGDATTIQGGVDLASPGDTVVVKLATYTDNHTVWIGASQYTVCVEMTSGVALVSGNVRGGAVIDGTGVDFGILCRSVSDGLVEGFEIMGSGYGIACWYGSEPVVRGNLITGFDYYGIDCYYGSNPVLVGNEIRDGYGVGVDCHGTSPHLIRNTITGNSGNGVSCFDNANAVLDSNLIVDNGGHGVWANSYSDCILRWNIITENDGSGVACHHFSAPVIHHNTLFQNRSRGIESLSSSNPFVGNNIIAMNQQHGIQVSWASVTLSCNNVWANSGGDYHGCSPAENDISANPLFCDLVGGNFFLDELSPCLVCPGCGQIGARGMGCQLYTGVGRPGSTETCSWGSLKAQHRHP